MTNTLLIIAETLLSFSFILIMIIKYKTDGIYVFGIVATFLACIIGLKKISILEMNMPIGIGITTSLIIGGNIITQKRGPSALGTYILLILITFLIRCLFINLSVFLKESNYNYYANMSYNKIFTLNIKYYLAFIISIITSIIVSSKIYYLLKRSINKIVLSNMLSIVIAEFIENIIFIIIAYIFEYKTVDLILCIVFRYTIKTIIGIVGTIPLYLANKVQ